MSRLRGQKWQRHRDSRMADVTAPPTVYQPQLVWAGPLPTSGASRTFPSCHPRLLLLCFLEKQRYRDDLSQPVQQAPKIPDADLRGIRNLGFPGSDGVMEEKAYGHSPHQPAQSRRASCVWGSFACGQVSGLHWGLFLHLCTDCCHKVRVTKPFLLCPHPRFIDTGPDHGHEPQFPLLLFLCLKVCSESENQCWPRTWIPTVTNFK